MRVVIKNHFYLMYFICTSGLLSVRQTLQLPVFQRELASQKKRFFFVNCKLSFSFQTTLLTSIKCNSLKYMRFDCDVCYWLATWFAGKWSNRIDVGFHHHICKWNSIEYQISTAFQCVSQWINIRLLVILGPVEPFPRAKELNSFNSQFSKTQDRSHYDLIKSHVLWSFEYFVV